MDIFEAIHGRRSIRKYTDEPVSDVDVKKILQAAMVAPSAGNQQRWQFVVVRDRETLERIKDVNPYVPMADHAPLGILVCGDVSLEKHPGFWVQDCSAAVQNLLLAVHGLGLGRLDGDLSAGGAGDRVSGAVRPAGKRDSVGLRGDRPSGAKVVV